MDDRESSDADGERTDANRANWDDRAAVHPETPFYDVDEFLDGQSSLRDIERRELGDVSGKSLLHLLCHIGLDGLSWAREGADVTGIDFSAEAIETARDIRDDAGLDAEFVCCDVYDVPSVVGREFDVVFASYGVLVWLSDVTAWAEVVARSLKPGGTFYLVDGHPVAHAFDADLDLSYSYFRTDPVRVESDGMYADEDAELDNTVTYQWTHSVGDVVNALLSAGLELEFLHEFPYGHFEKFDGMTEDDGRWHLNADGELPLLFSVKARKPRANEGEE